MRFQLTGREDYTNRLCRKRKCLHPTQTVVCENKMYPRKGPAGRSLSGSVKCYQALPH